MNVISDTYITKLPKRRSQSVFKLQRNNIASTRLGPGRTDRHSAHYLGTVIGREFTTLHQLYRLRVWDSYEKALDIGDMKCLCGPGLDLKLPTPSGCGA